MPTTTLYPIIELGNEENEIDIKQLMDAFRKLKEKIKQERNIDEFNSSDEFNHSIATFTSIYSQIKAQRSITSGIVVPDHVQSELNEIEREARDINNEIVLFLKLSNTNDLINELKVLKEKITRESRNNLSSIATFNSIYLKILANRQEQLSITFGAIIPGHDPSKWDAIALEAKKIYKEVHLLDEENYRRIENLAASKNMLKEIREKIEKDWFEKNIKNSWNRTATISARRELYLSYQKALVKSNIRVPDEIQSEYKEINNEINFFQKLFTTNTLMKNFRSSGSNSIYSQIVAQIQEQEQESMTSGIVVPNKIQREWDKIKQEAININYTNMLREKQSMIEKLRVLEQQINHGPGDLLNDKIKEFNNIYSKVVNKGLEQQLFTSKISPPEHIKVEWDKANEQAKNIHNNISNSQSSHIANLVTEFNKIKASIKNNVNELGTFKESIENQSGDELDRIITTFKSNHSKIVEEIQKQKSITSRISLPGYDQSDWNDIEQEAKRIHKEFDLLLSQRFSDTELSKTAELVKEFRGLKDEIRNTSESGSKLKDSIKDFNDIYSQIKTQVLITSKIVEMPEHVRSQWNKISTEAKDIHEEVNLLEQLANNSSSIPDYIAKKLKAINEDQNLVFDYKIVLARGCLLQYKKDLGKDAHCYPLGKELNNLLEKSAFQLNMRDKQCMTEFNKKFPTGPSRALNWMRTLYKNKPQVISKTFHKLKRRKPQRHHT